MAGYNLGLQLYTFRASEYNKESKYMADNVWSRWIRFRCTVQNYLEGDQYVEPVLELDIGATTNSDINMSDGDIEEVVTNISQYRSDV